MRILQITPLLSGLGGVQEYVAGMSSGLVSLGHEVRVLAAGSGPPHTLAADVDVIWHPRTTKVAGRFIVPRGLWRSVLSESRWADVVHAHQPFATGTLMAALIPVPLALSLHGDLEHVEGGRSRVRRRFQLRLLLRRVHLVVADSAAELALISTVGRPRAASVIWPGVRSAIGARRAGQRERPSVLSVARLVETKGIDRVIRAVSQIEGVDAAVVGDGPEMGRLRALSEELGFQADEILKGPVADEDVDDCFRSSDVFVSMSRQEGFGIAVLRAAAAGCRLVLSDIPPHREIVRELAPPSAVLLPTDASDEELTATLRDALDAGPLTDTVDVPTWADRAEELAAAYERTARRPQAG